MTRYREERRMQEHEQHREQLDTRDGGQVAVWCSCRIGADHTYLQWLCLQENADKLARSRDVWATRAIASAGSSVTGSAATS
jgi:hypothetical protein